jgi:Lon protease-like protein
MRQAGTAGWAEAEPIAALVRFPCRDGAPSSTGQGFRSTGEFAVCRLSLSGVIMENITDVIELPLFPLNTVLFPGQVLPLHIFEDRYRLMIRRCLAEDTSFGVVLIKQGRETGETAEPHLTGTMARIVESSHLPDGTMNILTVGTERFRILRLFHDQPYLRGEVEFFPMPEPDDIEPLTGLAKRVRVQIGRYIELIAQAAGLKIQVGDIPDAPQQIGYLAAVALQVENTEKQALLDSSSLAKILDDEMTLLRRENALLAWMAGTKEWLDQAQFGPSGTLLPN